MQLRLSNDSEYLKWLAEMKEKIRSSQLDAALKVNKLMLRLYWELGRAIDEKMQRSGWGDKVIPQLAKDLGMEFQGKGFGTTQLKYFRRWYQFYCQLGRKPVDQFPGTENQIVVIGQQPVDQIREHNGMDFPEILSRVPWGHHIQIFTKSNSVEEALFYIQETTKHNWPRKMLDHHLSSGLYKRKGRALTNFDMALPLPQAELAREMLKNPYNLGFLEIDEEASERDLENAIINNIVKFLQEIGPWFALMGKQYKLQVSEQDYFIDLLFYHTRLHCYLVIELKITEFIPEYAGKLEFYINAIDEQIKLPEDNQTIGLLLCKSADKIIVEYSLRTKTKPIGVAEYTHTLPRELVKELPTVTELRKELQKEIILAKKPIDEKLARIKDFISRINIEESREEKSDVSVHKIYTDVFLPLCRKMLQKLPEIVHEFHHIMTNYYQNGHYKLEYADAMQLTPIPDSKNIHGFTFTVTLQGFKKAGVNAFDIYQNIEVSFDRFKYYIGPDKQHTWAEKLYHQVPDATELDDIVERFFDNILTQLEDHLDRLFPNR